MLKRASEYQEKLRLLENKSYERLCELVAREIEKTVQLNSYITRISVYEANSFVWTKDEYSKNPINIDLLYHSNNELCYKLTNNGSKLKIQLENFGYKVEIHPKNGLTILII